jgi:hypothetical protein
MTGLRPEAEKPNGEKINASNRIIHNTPNARDVKRAPDQFCTRRVGKSWKVLVRKG